MLPDTFIDVGAGCMLGAGDPGQFHVLLGLMARKPQISRTFGVKAKLAFIGAHPPFSWLVHERPCFGKLRDLLHFAWLANSGK